MKLNVTNFTNMGKHLSNLFSSFDQEKKNTRRVCQGSRQPTPQKSNGKFKCRKIVEKINFALFKKTSSCSLRL